MDKQSFYIFIIWMVGICFGLFLAQIKRWLTEDYPIHREIKRRMRQPRPRAK